MHSNPFLAAVYTSQKILCAGLGPKVLASADLTVDVGPVKARREAKPLTQKDTGEAIRTVRKVGYKLSTEGSDD